jgi:predicted DNA-binding protein (MmcQ/YjbR family)
LNAEHLRRYCLAQAGAVEDFSFGDEVSAFKVGGKIFAISALHGQPLEVSLKCDPELAEALRGEHAAVRPGYHLNKRNWNTITLDGSIADEEIEGMIDDSYDLVRASLTRAQREALGQLRSRA